MTRLYEYERTSWSEKCPLCVQLKQRADAALDEQRQELLRVTALLKGLQATVRRNAHALDVAAADFDPSS